MYQQSVPAIRRTALWAAFLILRLFESREKIPARLRKLFRKLVDVVSEIENEFDRLDKKAVTK